MNVKGRPSSILGQKLVLLWDLYYERNYSLRNLAKVLGVSHMAVYRAISKGDSYE